MTEDKVFAGSFTKEWAQPIMRKVFFICVRLKEGFQGLAEIGKSPVMLLNIILPYALTQQEIETLSDKKNENMRKLTGMIIKQIICEDGEFEHIPKSSKELPEPLLELGKTKIEFGGKKIYRFGGLYIRIKAPQIKLQNIS